MLEQGGTLVALNTSELPVFYFPLQILNLFVCFVQLQSTCCSNIL